MDTQTTIHPWCRHDCPHLDTTWSINEPEHEGTQYGCRHPLSGRQRIDPLHDSCLALEKGSPTSPSLPVGCDSRCSRYIRLELQLPHGRKAIQVCCQEGDANHYRGVPLDTLTHCLKKDETAAAATCGTIQKEETHARIDHKAKGFC